MKGILTVAVLMLAPAAYANDDVAVRCVARNASGLTGAGSARGGSYHDACNRAAAEAFASCAGQYYDGSFAACTSGGGWRGRMDDGVAERDDSDRSYRRQPLDANWRSCFAYMYCRVVNR